MRKVQAVRVAVALALVEPAIAAAVVADVQDRAVAVRVRATNYSNSKKKRPSTEDGLSVVRVISDSFGVQLLFPS